MGRRSYSKGKSETMEATKSLTIKGRRQKDRGHATRRIGLKVLEQTLDTKRLEHCIVANSIIIKPRDIDLKHHLN